MEVEVHDLENSAGTRQSARKANKGSFCRGDFRINRRGRPPASIVAARRARNGKPLSGRLTTLELPLSDLRQFLSGQRHPWLTNLPADFRIVDVRVHIDRSIAEFILHSTEFEVVRDGGPLPAFSAAYNGLMWRRRSV